MIKYLWLLAALLLACGAEDIQIDDYVELEQEYSAAHVSGGGQIIGVEQSVSVEGPRCSSTQLSNARCAFVQSDPFYNVQFANWYSVKLDSSWDGTTYLTDVSTALSQVMNQMSAQSTINGTAWANFFMSTGPDIPEIVVKRTSSFTPPSSASPLLTYYVRTTFSGMTPALTESTSMPGEWQRAEQCVITIDAADLQQYGNPGGMFFKADVFKQAIGNGFLKCLGLGRAYHTVQGAPTYTPYSHPEINQNVFSGQRFFTNEERCLYFYSCFKNTACGGATNIYFQPIGGVALTTRNCQ